MRTSAPRIGYGPISQTLSTAGDRRRFVGWAKKRGVPFEIARPSEKYDIVILSQMADISVWADYPHGKLVFDFIDDYLSLSQWEPKQFLRGTFFFLKKRHSKLFLSYRKNLEAMCRRADVVICSSNAQKSKLNKLCSDVRVILDIQEDEVSAVKICYQLSNRPRLVWEGQGQNISAQIGLIAPTLDRFYKGKEYEVSLVTDPTSKVFWGLPFTRNNDFLCKENLSFKLTPWSKENLAREFVNADIGLIPIDLSNQFAVGKPMNKLLLMWRFGIPTITSATPAYRDALEECGFPELACRTDQDWHDALKKLSVDINYRESVGRAGRIFAQQKYSNEAILTLWDRLLRKLGWSY